MNGLLCPRAGKREGFNWLLATLVARAHCKDRRIDDRYRRVTHVSSSVSASPGDACPEQVSQKLLRKPLSSGRRRPVQFGSFSLIGPSRYGGASSSHLHPQTGWRRAARDYGQREACHW